MSNTDFTIALSLSQPISPEVCPTLKEFQHWFAACYKITDTLPLNTAHSKSHEISLQICTPEEMATLNQQYRNKPSTTNVLAFPASSPALTDAPSVPLGDIVFCAHTIHQEAKEQDKQPTQHWAHISIHGLLHLKGFDHETPQEAEEMEALETRVLAQLGFPNPYIQHDNKRLTEQT